MKKSLFASFMMLVSLAAYAQPQVVAHRGYWKTEGSAQNSVTSMELAAKHKLYGCEFDVWQTSDGVLVCNHDGVIDGIRIEDVPYAKVQYCKMSNGELMPTVAQYLREGAKYPHLKMVFEIKTHKNDERNASVVDNVIRLVRELGVQNQVEYIAFSKFICERLHKLDPQAKVAYLNGNLSPKEVKALGLSGIDYNHSVFKKNPSWLKEAKECGLEVNVWTVNGEQALKEHAANPYIDLITTDDPIVLKKILKGGKKNKDGKKGKDGKKNKKNKKARK
ncbi:MAG: glycerophosphodiester phosphodiesterase [Bacteroidaceae bacterium]|nr:glycerophosphodiester phosphodiesterase [Bacteroidaceae bacterium]